MSEKIQTVEIDSLQTHPLNPRKGDVAAIMRSLEHFGQVKPIVVQKSTGYVVAGNHTLRAAQELGWTTIEAMILDIDDEKANGYLIADNRTADRATYDRGALSSFLGKTLSSLEGTGFDESDLETLAEELSGSKNQRRALDPVEIESEEIENEGPEPVREFRVAMPTSKFDKFAGQVVDLQQLWGLRTLSDIIVRVVDETHNRWQASADAERGSRHALPPELVATEY